MHIIIDGYNVLKQVIEAVHVSERQRRAFIALLGRYAARKKHNLLVVFDAGPTTLTSQEKDHGITVIYSGTKQNADEVIKQMLRTRPHGILLVSSDNELKRAATQTGAQSINAPDFYALVKQELAPKNTQSHTDILIKTSETAESWVDELLRADRQTMYKQEDEGDHQRRSPAQKLSKKERALAHKVKKL